MKTLFSIIGAIFFVQFQCFSNEIDISYHQNTEASLAEIMRYPSSEWKNYEKAVYQPEDNGSTWFKIDFQEVSSGKYYIEISSIFVLSGDVYSEHQAAQNSGESSFQNFWVTVSDVNKPLYIKVTSAKRSHIPLTVDSEYELVKKRSNSLIFYSIYYTIALMILVITLGSYYQYRDKSYLIYLGLMVTVNVNRSVAEGQFLQLIDSLYFTICLDQTIHILIAYIGYHFTVNYLEIDALKRNKLFKLVFISMVGSSILLVIYFFTANSWFSFFSDVFVLFGVNSILYFAAMQFKKSAYAKFYCFAFFPLMFAGYDVYFLEPLGIKLIEMNFIEYRMGMIIEMMVLTFAIVYKGRVVIKENNHLHESIIRMSQELTSTLPNTKETTNPKKNLASQFGLTKQEIAVLDHILEGRKNQQIADKLFVSLNTIKFHNKNIYRKLEINSKKEAVEKLKS